MGLMIFVPHSLVPIAGIFSEFGIRHMRLIDLLLMPYVCMYWPAIGLLAFM